MYIGTTGKKVCTPSHVDRFIPSRSELSSSDSGLPQLQLSDSENVHPGSENADYKSSLAQSLFHGDDLNCKILAFKKKAPKPSEVRHFCLCHSIYDLFAGFSEQLACCLQPKPRRWRWSGKTTSSH